MPITAAAPVAPINPVAARARKARRGSASSTVLAAAGTRRATESAKPSASISGIERTSRASRGSTRNSRSGAASCTPERAAAMKQTKNRASAARPSASLRRCGSCSGRGKNSAQSADQRPIWTAVSTRRMGMNRNAATAVVYSGGRVFHRRWTQNQ